MELKEKILCGSSMLFKDIKDFKPGDEDYLILSNNDEVFCHTHPIEGVCHFIWGRDKDSVKKYMLDFPYYLPITSLVVKDFIEHYELTHEDVKKIINRHRKVYKNSVYRYYIPLFEYIYTYYNWDFPKEIIMDAYKLYMKFKKR